MRSGDLLFEAGASSEMSEAIVASTASNDSLNFIHVAIAYVDSVGNNLVIEASPRNGVRMIGLVDFLAESTKIGGQPAVVVKRLVDDYPVQIVIENAKSHLGEPYDWHYLPDNGKMYCSELVYEAFVNADSERIFEAKPMNFRASDGSMPKFWADLFNELGMDVPEGVLGTNPNDLSRHNSLVEVFRFF